VVEKKEKNVQNILHVVLQQQNVKIKVKVQNGVKQNDLQTSHLMNLLLKSNPQGEIILYTKQLQMVELYGNLQKRLQKLLKVMIINLLLLHGINYLEVWVMM
jgi:hypothetical protein